MCDSIGAITGYLTYKDVQNAITYAKMRIMYDQIKNVYSDKLKWVPANPDGSTDYRCPPGLEQNCKDGRARIKDKTVCDGLSVIDRFLQNPDTDIFDPDIGFYLEWRSPDNSPTNGQCYLGNPFFFKMCKTGNFSNDDEHRVDGLYYDENSGRCFITQDYCKNTGQLAYNDATKDVPSYLSTAKDANGNLIAPMPGGSCELTGGQKALDFFFGETVARGLAGGKCFKK